MEPGPYELWGRTVLAAVCTLVLAVFLRCIGGYVVPHILNAVAKISRKARGALLILVVVFLWTGSSIIIQMLFEGQGHDLHFRKPFLVSYISTVLFVSYLPFYPARLAAVLSALCAEMGCSALSQACSRTSGPSYGLVGGVATHPDSADEEDFGDHEAATETAANSGLTLAHLEPLQDAWTALKVGALFCSSNLLFNMSLEMNSISTSTIMASTSGIWTMVFCKLLLKKRIGLVRVISVFTTLSGVVLVVLSNWRHNSSAALEAMPAITNGVALSSAVLYGLYVTSLDSSVPSEEALPMPFLFGLIGLFYAVIALPLIAVFHFLRLEHFSLPSQETLVVLVMNALIGTVVANVLLARAILLTSPLIATVSLSLSVPMSIYADVWRHRVHMTRYLIVGSLLVWVGFLCVSSAEGIEAWLESMRPAARKKRRAAKASSKARGQL